MRKNTDNGFSKAVLESASIAEVIRKLKKPIVGSSYRWVKRHVLRLGLDTSHWKGKAHGTTKQVKICWSKVLVRNSKFRMSHDRKGRLIREGLLKNICFRCNSEPKWMGMPLVLRLDHKNGIRDDNRIENLRMVCPNCDSQLPTFCGRNKRLLRTGSVPPL